MPKERMSPYLSVFNGHLNDADNRARAILQEFMPDYFTRIKELETEGGGIMYIFSAQPEFAVIAYAALVTAFVNE